MHSDSVVRDMPIKKTVEDLARFGGSAVFSERIHVGRPNIGCRDKFLKRLNDILDSKWLTNHGPNVQEFEAKIADFCGVRHCVSTSNGTMALEIAIRALGLTGEVIVPAFTFVATAHALQWQEITPVFCDVDPVTHNLNPEKIESLITSKTTGIIPVHLWGNPCGVEEVESVAKKHDLQVVYDASHAFGCSHKDRMVGSFGSVEVFSFHATKFINSFEGGGIVTDNDELAEKMRLMTNFGFAGMDKVIHLGTNGKMSEVSAAMGLTNLECMSKIVDQNFENYQSYKAILANIPGIRFFTHTESEKRNFQYVVIELDEEVVGLSRDIFMEILHAENVLARRYFYPGCHRMAPYEHSLSGKTAWLPETEKLLNKVLVLPTGTDVCQRTIEKICAIIIYSIEHASDIRKMLEASGVEST